MKRTRLRSCSQPKRGKPLKRSGSLKRKTRLCAKGGSMFPLTAEDKAQWKWMRTLARAWRQPCDGCGKVSWLMRCHVIAKSRGGRVIDNIVLLDWACHDRQEKKNEQYEAEMDVDLHAKARGYTAQWRKETGQ